MTTEGRLPDFIFCWNFAAEREVGFLLAGLLITDLPKTTKPRGKDKKLIRRAIRQLTEVARENLDMSQAGIWRTGKRPADGMEPPFSDALMAERIKRCVCIEVRIDPGPSDRIKLDTDLVRQLTPPEPRTLPMTTEHGMPTPKLRQYRDEPSDDEKVLMRVVVDLCAGDDTRFAFGLLPHLADMHPGAMWDLATVFVDRGQGDMAELIAEFSKETRDAANGGATA
jgi:hypothetical protein